MEPTSENDVKLVVRRLVPGEIEENERKQLVDSAPAYPPACRCGATMTEQHDDENDTLTTPTCTSCGYMFHGKKFYQCPTLDSDTEITDSSVSCSNPMKYCTICGPRIALYDSRREPIDDIYNVDKLYFIYSDHTIQGPFTTKDIIILYVNRKLNTDRIWIKRTATHSEWYELQFPDYIAKNAFNRVRNTNSLLQTKLQKCEAKNETIKREFPDLYRSLVENVLSDRIRIVDVPATAPKEAESSVRVRVLKAFTKCLFIFICIIVFGHILPIGALLFGAFFVGVTIKTNCCSSNPYSERDILLLSVVFTSIFIASCSGLFIAPILVTHFILRAEIYKEIQSWMVAYIAWGIFIFLFITAYVLSGFTRRRGTWVQNILFVIVGLQFDIDFNYILSTAGKPNTSGIMITLSILFVFPALASVLPATIAGFVANFIFEEKFLLKCSEDVVNDQLCFDEQYGCCDIISSHEFQNMHVFIGGLTSNILASWAVIRIVGYLVTNSSSTLRLYVKRKN
eukprot:281266_1